MCKLIKNYNLLNYIKLLVSKPKSFPLYKNLNNEPQKLLSPMIFKTYVLRRLGVEI